MRSTRMICCSCVLVLSGCANGAAEQLDDRTRAPVTTKPDAGASNSGGTTGMTGAIDTDDDGGATSGGGTNNGGTSGGTTTGTGDGGPPPPAQPTGVLITEVMARPSAGSDNEWIEVFNGGTTALALMGCALATGTDASDETLIDAALSIAPGAYFLFGRDGVQSQSGVKPDYVYDGIYLSPDETVTLSCNGQIVSQISYAGAQIAASLQLDARYVKAGKLDVPAAWCDGKDALPLSSNLGTPKAANRECPLAPAP